MEDFPESGTASIVKAGCGKKRRKKSRSRGRSSCRKFRGGRKTRNAFLNFLRAYRRQCCGKNVKEIAKNGAKLWNCMSEKQKAPYYKMACKVPKRSRSKCRKRSRVRRKSRPCPNKSACGKPKRSACRPKKKKSKPCVC